MDEVAFLEVLGEGCARVLDSGTWQDWRVLAGRLQRRPRQAGHELVRAHVRQEAVGADGIAGDASDDAAVGPVLPA